MLNWLAPHPCVAVKNRKEYLGCGGIPRKMSGLIATLGWTPQSKALMPGSGDHTKSGCEKQWGFHPSGKKRSLLESQLFS